MKKTMLSILLIITMLGINVEKVNAKITGGYNGGSNPTNPGVGQCGGMTSSKYCVYNNGNHATIRISFVKYDGKNITKIGKSVYYTDANYKIDTVYVWNFGSNTVTPESTAGQIDTVGQATSFYSKSVNGARTIDSDKIEAYFINNNEKITKNAMNVLSYMEIPEDKYGDIFTTMAKFEEHLKELAKKKSKIKYRFIIEPVYSFSDGNKWYYYTVKAYAHSGKTITNTNRWCELASVLVTEYDDIGIKTGVNYGSHNTGCADKNNALNSLNYLLSGNGYNIVDLTKNVKTDDDGGKEEPVKYCSYTNEKHFKLNINGTKKPNATSGSGPNGENCCKLNQKHPKTGKTNLQVYREQYKKQTGNSISAEDFKKWFYKNYEKYNCEIKYCDYTNPEHFKNASATGKTGSGPNGENCCNVDWKHPVTGITNFNTYKTQMSKDSSISSIPKTKKEMKEFLKRYHPECIEATPPNPTVKKASCSGNSVSKYDQGASIDTMRNSILNEYGHIEISDNKYLREEIGGDLGAIVCSESVELTLPKLYQNAVYRGMLLEWPTYENGLRLNTNPLTLKGKINCYLEIDYSQIRKDHAYPCGPWGIRTCYDEDAIAYDVDYIQRRAKKWKTETKNHYDLDGTFQGYYNDPDYGGYFIIQKYGDSHLSYKYTGFNFDNLGGEFTIEQTVKYRIDPETYRYVLKLKNNSNLSIYRYQLYNYVYNISNNYLDIGYGNLPISNDAPDGRYETTIYYSNLGGFSKNNFATTQTAYTCEYDLTSDTPAECICDDYLSDNFGMDLSICQSGGCDGKIYTCNEAKDKYCYTEQICEPGDPDCPDHVDNCECPADTERAGWNLLPYVEYYDKGKTCSQVQQKYCNAPMDCIPGDPNCPDECPSWDPNCNPTPSDKLVCPNGTNYAGQNILTRVCYQNYNCTYLTCNVYTCPDNTPNAGKKINTYIMDYIAINGGKIDNTILDNMYKKYCYTNSDDDNKPSCIPGTPGCSNGGGGSTGGGKTPGNGRNNIIYRVIDLNNPFPGKSGTTRDPGANWYYRTKSGKYLIVQKYITNNRGVKTNEVYDKANAMYHFVLDSKTIRAIREYNKKNPYDDFTLECKANGGRDCISKFIRDSQYGLQQDGSKCYSASNFSSCRNIK